MIRRVLFVIFYFLIGHSYANVLPPDSPERRQLIAMGYELGKENAGDQFTIAEFGSTRILLSKNEDRLALSRFFSIQRKLNQDDQVELLRILNKFNESYSIQFSLGDQFLTANLYIFGNYEPKTFAKVVRILDKVETVFDTEPRFFKLVNN